MQTTTDKTPYPQLYTCCKCGFLSTRREAFTLIENELYCDYCKGFKDGKRNT